MLIFASVRKTDYTNSAGTKRSGFEVTSKTNGNSIFLPASVS